MNLLIPIPLRIVFGQRENHIIVCFSQIDVASIREDMGFTESIGDKYSKSMGTDFKCCP